MQFWKRVPLKQLLWWAAVVLALAGAALWIWFRQGRPDGAYAKITCGNAEQIVPLDADGEFGLEASPDIRFEIKDGAIRFIDADCPDKVCEKAGFLSKTGETAACLPRETVLVVIGGKSGEGVDGIAG